MRDLIVAGGGPAGLATALYAVRAGLDVTVWEPRTGVVDKACGEGLMPGAVRALAELGVDPAGHDLAGIRYVDGAHRAEARFRAGPGRGVRRTVLHGALLDAVRAAGVPVVHRAVHKVDQDAAGVTCDGDRARFLVAADGLHSPTRRALGLDAPARDGRARRFGLRRHAAVRPWSPFVEVHWAGLGEAYVTPVAENAVGIALLTTTRGRFEDHLRAFPALADRIEGAGLGPVRGAGPLRQRSRQRVRGRVLLVGDAAGYVDALTGEGVSLALAQARVAVASLVAGEPDRYDREWPALTRRYRLLTEALLSISSHPAGRRALVPSAQRAPGLFRVAVNALARPV